MAAADGGSECFGHAEVPSTALPSLWLITPSVVLAGSKPSQAVLTGRGIASRAASLYCRSCGQHQVANVLRVRHSVPVVVDGPDTPPSADRPSADSEAEDGPAEAPLQPGGHAGGGLVPPSAEELLLGRLELEAGEDAVLVELPPVSAQQPWGLFEFEVAQGERAHHLTSRLCSRQHCMTSLP